MCYLLPILGVAVLMAQIGPQYPPGGGGYPGGQGNPRTGGGNTGPSLPRFPGKKKTGKPTEKQLQNLTNLEGVLRRMDEKVLVLQADDKRILTLYKSDETKLLKNGEEAKSAEFVQGDHLIVECAQDDDNKFLVVRINWQKAGTEQERVAARGPLPPEVRFEDDLDAATAKKIEAEQKPKGTEGPPRLTRNKGAAAAEEAKAEPAKEQAKAVPVPEPEAPRETATLVVDKLDLEPVPKVKRGKPAPRPRSADDDADTAATAAAPVRAGGVVAGDPLPATAAAPASVVATTEGSGDALLERAKESVLNFSETLPNYTVKQMTTRFVGSGKGDRWQPQDNFVADVVYDDGKESYRNVMLNGKAAKGKVEQTGAWSRGEFGTTIRDVFSPASNATFRPRGNTTIVNRKAKYYDFAVDQENSHWQISVPGQTYFPAYRGTVWIDVETARVLRLEMQGRKLPEAFPIDSVESALDYDFVKIGGASYLVPVHSENLSCFRGQSTCAKNVIDFRNYRKFGAQSDLIFNQ